MENIIRYLNLMIPKSILYKNNVIEQKFSEYPKYANKSTEELIMPGSSTGIRRTLEYTPIEILTCVLVILYKFNPKHYPDVLVDDIFKDFVKFNKHVILDLTLIHPWDAISGGKIIYDPKEFKFRSSFRFKKHINQGKFVRRLLKSIITKGIDENQGYYVKDMTIIISTKDQ